MSEGFQQSYDVIWLKFLEEHLASAWRTDGVETREEFKKTDRKLFHQLW